VRAGGRTGHLAAVWTAVALCLAGCTVDGREPLGSLPSRTSGVEGESLSSEPAEPSATTTEPPSQPVPPEPAAPAVEQVDPAAVADLAAGVLERRVPDPGPGTTTVVPGAVPAVAPGEPVRVRVEVEDGLPVDGAAFAAFVITTLQDPRGWVQEGYAFSRTDGDADVVVTLASPTTSARMCAPLDTGGTLSCRNGDDVVLTHHRWVGGADAYGEDRTSYRQYLVTHEVGHAIGHGHVECPGPGRPAPTMMQQTKGVGACVAQPWPYPSATP
jgi:hypothetical protein